MSLEEGTSFWSSSLMWKVFFCAAIAFPTYNAGKNVFIANNTSEYAIRFIWKPIPEIAFLRDLFTICFFFFLDTSESVHGENMYFFGRFNETTINFSYSEFPIFIVFGVFGGLVGALFVNINYRLSIFRMKLVFIVMYIFFLSQVLYTFSNIVFLLLFRYILSNRKKLLESVSIAVLVAIISLTSMVLLNYCQLKTETSSRGALQVRSVNSIIILNI